VNGGGGLLPASNYLLSMQQGLGGGGGGHFVQTGGSYPGLHRRENMMNCEGPAWIENLPIAPKVWNFKC